MRKLEKIGLKNFPNHFGGNRNYKNSNNFFEESITLNIAKEKYKYDRIEYKIKNKK